MNVKPTKISDFFGQKKIQNKASNEVIDLSIDTPDITPDISDPFSIEDIAQTIQEHEHSSDDELVILPTRRFRTTIEEVDDEGDKLRECLTETAEDGLDDPWDPSQEILPHSIQPCPTYIPGPILFTNANETFAKDSETSIGAKIPDNHAVDQAIRNLQKKLHPPCQTGGGYKDPQLPMLLQTRLELMARFLRLYQASKYTG